jgi:hypothetical protein
MTGPFISTKIVIDIETGRVLEREGFFYSGPVAQLKKGRQQAEQAATGGVNLGNQASKIATQNQGIQQGYRAAGDTAASTYFGNVNPQTGLGKATTSQYELDIERTAQDSAPDPDLDASVGAGDAGSGPNGSGWSNPLKPAKESPDTPTSGEQGEFETTQPPSRHPTQALDCFRFHRSRSLFDRSFTTRFPRLELRLVRMDKVGTRQLSALEWAAELEMCSLRLPQWARFGAGGSWLGKRAFAN